MSSSSYLADPFSFLRSLIRFLPLLLGPPAFDCVRISSLYLGSLSLSISCRRRVCVVPSFFFFLPVKRTIEKRIDSFWICRELVAFSERETNIGQSASSSSSLSSIRLLLWSRTRHRWSIPNFFRRRCKNINMPKCWAVAAVAAAATSSQEPGHPSGRQIPSSATVVVVDRDPHHLRV